MEFSYEAKKCSRFTFSSVAFLVTKDMKDGKYRFYLCNLDATLMSSIGRFNIHREKDLETEGAPANAIGSSLLESHCATKFSLNFARLSFRKRFGKVSCNIFYSVSSCASFLLMNFLKSSVIGQSVCNFCKCWDIKKARVLKCRLAYPLTLLIGSIILAIGN